MLQPDNGLKLVLFLLSSWQSSSACGGVNRKARRKDRDGDQTVPDTKPYLDENVLDRKLPDADLRTIVDLPAGLDYNEWLASHSEYRSKVVFIVVAVAGNSRKGLNKVLRGCQKGGIGNGATKAASEPDRK